MKPIALTVDIHDIFNTIICGIRNTFRTKTCNRKLNFCSR